MHYKCIYLGYVIWVACIKGSLVTKWSFHSCDFLLMKIKVLVHHKAHINLRWRFAQLPTDSSGSVEEYCLTDSTD